MDKIGIVSHGISDTMLLIAETEGDKITAKELDELAVRAKCSVEQIEVVSEEEYIMRLKEMGQTYTITQPPKIESIPDIYMENVSCGVNKHKLRAYTDSDNVCYNKKIKKRRKKNKNKKTHRK